MKSEKGRKMCDSRHIQRIKAMAVVGNLDI